MDIAAADVPPGKMYKLLVSTVMPRPIALVSTLNAEGAPNAAPFSFFNVFSDAPPLVVIGIEARRGDGRPHKDTARNIIDRGEFVVNLVSHAIAEQMVVCAVDFPEGVDEFAESGFTPRPSKQIKVPGIAEAPVSFECKVFNLQALPHNRTLVTGQIVHLHFRDGLVDDNMHIDTVGLDLVGRMQGGGWYSTTRDCFQIPLMTVDGWRAKKDKRT